MVQVIDPSTLDSLQEAVRHLQNIRASLGSAEALLTGAGRRDLAAMANAMEADVMKIAKAISVHPGYKGRML